MSVVVFEPFMPLIVVIWVILMVALGIGCVVVYLKRRKAKRERMEERYQHKFH